MGSWYRGNDPASQTGNPSLESRVYCEAMYQINECEKATGRPCSSWDEIGTFPATDAIVGTIGAPFATPSGYKYLSDMQLSINDLAPRFYTSAWVPYTKATLLTEAIGKSDWTALSGQAICDGTAISEVLKATELLTRTRINPPLGGYPSNAVGRDGYKDSGFVNYVATFAQLHTECESDVASWSNWGYYESEDTADVFHQGRRDWPQINDYSKGVATVKLDVSPMSELSGVSIHKATIRYSLYDNTSNTYWEPSTVYVRVLSASQYGSDPWSATGTLMHTISLPSTFTSDVQTEDVDTPSAIDPTENYLYLQYVPQSTTPFSDSGPKHQSSGITIDSTISDYIIRIQYTFTHTYG